MNESDKRISHKYELPSLPSWQAWRLATADACTYTMTLDGGAWLYGDVAPGDAILLTDADGRNATGVRRVYLLRQEGEKTVVFFDRKMAFKPPYTLTTGQTELALTTSTASPMANSPLRRMERPLFENILTKAGAPRFEVLPMFDEHDKGNQRYVRDLLQLAVKDDLLGPACGEQEEIVGMSVRDRYLVGKLAPQDTGDAGRKGEGASDEDRENPDELDLFANKDHQSHDDSTATGPDDEDEEPEVDQSLNQSLTPSSLGFTFCIDKDLKEVELTASWGRYVRADSEFAINPKNDKPLRCWKRVPSGGTLSLAVNEGRIAPVSIDADSPAVKVQGDVTKVLPNGSRLMTLFLVNTQEAPDTNRDVAWVFQPEMRVYAKDGRAIFLRRPFQKTAVIDDELQSLDMIYRKDVEFAVGHGISVHISPSEEDCERATEIRTVVMPEYEVPVTETPGGEAEDRPAMKKLQADGLLDMRRIAGMELTELTTTLNILVDDYEKWLDESEANALLPDVKSLFAEPAESAIANGRSILGRLREGVATLSSEPTALKAFQFANRVMAEQRVHGIYALSQRRKETTPLPEFDIPRNHTWRPFQLAFILLSLPSLTNPKHNDRTSVVAAIADLLWFPTGGGKTEAYLGVAAFAMAIRRLNPTQGGLDGSRGLAVIMRYTLRLLTIQQFQRASTLICAMELERQKSPTIWGTAPFTLGLWVGQKTTPNTTEESHNAIERARDRQFGTGSTPAQLTTCPWCGAEIQEGREIIVDRDIGKTRIFCGDSHGSCSFSRAKNPEGLPVVVVDEEIYHRPPSMLIATVDKFAMMAWKGAVKTLFGKVDKECERHGFVLPDTDCTGSHPRKKSLPSTTVKPATALRPPDLIIQDEFHLISGPLGTMVGLYETAVDELCSWKMDELTIRPKIIASTATVRKAAEQINNVFLRKVAVFPQHGLTVQDNFFSVQRPIVQRPGRRYLGVCAPGATRPAVLIRVYVALLTGSKALFDSFGLLADPYMTLVGYFNSLRELGGMRRLSEDDVQTRSYRVALSTHVARPGLAQRSVRNVDELTSRVSNKDIPKKLDQLEVKFKAAWVRGETRAMDIVLATNMLSVGVDVNRLGLMVVNGQPKNTAEYIQATSRVGRAFPGLVCTVLTWSRPRDLSHYETFEYYHQTFYKHVEAQSVTPFAARATDRGLTGVMASILRLGDDALSPNLGAGMLMDTSRPSVAKLKDTVTVRAWRISEKERVRDRTETMLKDRIDLWIKEANEPGRKLGYEKPSRQGDVINLLQKPGIKQWERFTVPLSMREVEPGVRLIMDKTVRQTPDPEWEAFAPNNDSEEDTNA